MLSVDCETQRYPVNHQTCAMLAACFPCGNRDMAHSIVFDWGLDRWHWYCLGTLPAAHTNAPMPISSGGVSFLQTRLPSVLCFWDLL